MKKEEVFKVFEKHRNIQRGKIIRDTEMEVIKVLNEIEKELNQLSDEQIQHKCNHKQAPL